MAAKDDLGRHGEHLAAQFLVDAGYTVIDRNWRCPRGEIDLVVRDGNDTVFVEVKTRSSTAFGHPFEAITTQKIARLRRLAVAWCEAHPERRVAARRAAADTIDADTIDADTNTSDTNTSEPDNSEPGTSESGTRESINSESGNSVAPNAAFRQGLASRGAIRIDAISVIASAGKAPVIEHLRRVF